MTKKQLKLDTAINERLDTIVEDDVRRGWKVLPVPTDMQDLLANEGLPRIAYVRFSRMNPARKRRVAELVQRQYHKDLQDETLLSHAQVMALATKRGEWTPEHEKRLAELGEQANKEMALLYAAGFASGSDQWVETVQRLAATVRETLDGADEMLEIFQRWLDYTVAEQERYTTSYAAAQGLERYSVDRDFTTLTAQSETVAALIEEISELKDRIETYFTFLKIRTEQVELQVKRDRIFDQTAESRRDTAEELARLLVTATVCTETGEDLGPITATFETLWNYPFETLQFLTSEAYLFHSGIPDEAREYLEVFGFLARTPANGASTPSAGSPDAATSSSDSPALVTTDPATSG